MGKLLMEYRIVPIETRHMDRIVDIHLRAFPSFFLTFLGPRFLLEIYRVLPGNPETISLVAEEVKTGKVIGFIFGPLIPAGFFRRLLKRRWWRFILASVVPILKKPRIIPRIFRAVFHTGDEPEGPPRALLSEVSVDPDYQGIGIGKALNKAWVKEVRRHEVSGCYLITDAENNETVNRFYESQGWKLEFTYKTPEGRVMNRYVCDFPDLPGKRTNNG